jgi:hypothetical protein
MSRRLAAIAEQQAQGNGWQDKYFSALEDTDEKY